MHSDKLKEELRILREENGRLKALLSDIYPHDLQSNNTAEINNAVRPKSWTTCIGVKDS